MSSLLLRKEKQMKKVIEVALGALVSLVIAWFIVFIGINMILGCETWDQELWTETNSCLTFSQALFLD
jgi:high-affinity Fe2+/Pb2+ permease